MKLLKRQKSDLQTDDIPEKIHKRLHLIYFFIKCVIAAMIFLLFYNNLCIIFLEVPDFASEDAPFLKHEYCGTFYVEINRDNSFTSPEAYTAYLEKENQPTGIKLSDVILTVAALTAAVASAVMLITKKLPKFMSKRTARLVIVLGVCFLFAPSLVNAVKYFCYMLILFAIRSGDKKTIFSNKASDYFLIGGVLWTIVTVISEIGVFLGTKSQGEGLTGVFSRPAYYFQLYDLFGLPLIMLCAGLMLRRHELDLAGEDISKNTSALKYTGYAALAGTAGFVIWRLSVRIYEVIRVMNDSGYMIKLPFTVMDIPYNRLIELPPELANTPQDYRNAVLCRFVKDLPVFIFGTLAVWFFVKVLFAVSKGELNTVLNRRRLNVSMILLIAASLWFNLMGIRELDLFNNGFGGIYGEVVYTVALRSKTEPALYALVLWFFKTYLQAVPETKEIL